ncbi:MAG: VOC family protein [Pseudomonadota bacterium]
MNSFRRLAAAALIALSSSAQAEPPDGTEVTGFGGFFFRAEDPKTLADWYLHNLGIDRVPTTYDVEPWTQDAGPTVFSPYPETSDALAPAGKVFMLNFRTEDLDGLVAHLRENGSEVTVEEEVYPNGRFATLEDPEGNPIQLWEPKDPSN